MGIFIISSLMKKLENWNGKKISHQKEIRQKSTEELVIEKSERCISRSKLYENEMKEKQNAENSSKM